MKSRFLVQKDGHVAWLLHNRPEALNAMKNEHWKELSRAIEEIESDPDIRVAVIAGEGRAFCAGADLKEMQEDLTWFSDRTKRLNELRAIQNWLQDTTRKIRASRLPYIAAVHGYAVGAGLELCMACDLIVLERGTQLGFPEVNNGTTITNGASYFAPRIMGLSKVRELAYTGEFMDAEEAYRLGFVSRMAEQGCARREADVLARKIASRSPGSVTAHKRMLDMAIQSSLEASLVFETEALILTAYSNDHVEGVAACLEKRPATFTGA